ncbi:MAG: tRNA pseudouridine(55) synthase TruB [Cellulosilyticaceae bacterium]
MIHGIINIRKEKGFTSHDVVAKARGILRERKIGHTGTLDPDATGVLPICIGKATRIVPYLTEADKCYEAEVILGAYTTTEDATGEITETFEVNVTKQQIQDVVESFIGNYTQVPPMYSAIKINGVRLYELARQGIVVDRPSRDVMIYECDIIKWVDEKRFYIRVNCSKGTYIRTLCTDIGKKLGCGAYMGDLVRTRVDNYDYENSITLTELEQLNGNIENILQPIDSIFLQYPKYVVKKEYEKFLYNGNPVSFDATTELLNGDIARVRIYDEADNFIGIYNVNKENSTYIVERLFITN